VTVAQAADALSISQDAVRKRIARGTIPHDRDESGRVYVYLSPSETVHKTDQDTVQDDAAKTVQDTYIRSLEDQIAFLRGELERKDAILLNLTERIPELEAPSEASDAVEAVEEAPDSAEPHSAAGGAQESAERPQQLSGWLAPVDKLPWWHYVIGISLVFLAEATRSILWSHVPVGILSLVSLLGFLMQTYLPPGIFGLWVGYRRRDPRFLSQTIPFGALVGIVVWLGYNFGLAIDQFNDTGLVDALVAEMKYFFPQDLIYLGCAAWLFYVSAYLIGHARQRRRTGRISGATPASPVSRAAQGPAQRPRKDLTPAQQAILGWGGAIISALITLVGTIVSTRSGP